MAEKDRFKALARKTYLSYHQDGIIDLIIGACTLAFGLDMLVKGSYLSAIIWLPVIMYMPLKKRITIPRFGFVQFDTDAKLKQKLSVSLVGGLFMLLLMIGVVIFSGFDRMTPNLREWMSSYYMLIIGALWIIGFLGTAAITGIKRFNAYALITVLIIYGGVFLPIEPPYTMIALGGVILLSASYLLIRFMQTYPPPSEEGAQ